MKKVLLTMLAVVMTVVSYAQPFAEFKAKAMFPEHRVKQTMVVDRSKQVMAKPNFLRSNSDVDLKSLKNLKKEDFQSFTQRFADKKMTRRSGGDISVDLLQGDYVCAQNQFALTESGLVPLSPACMSTIVTIEAGADNAVNIFGLMDPEVAVTGTFDPQTGVITIPGGQKLTTDEEVGDVTMTPIIAENFTATIGDGLILFNEPWVATYIDSETSKAAMYSNVIGTVLFVPNAVASYSYVDEDSKQKVDANDRLYIQQDEKTFKVSVFGLFGMFCFDIDMLSDRTFYVNYEQVLYKIYDYEFNLLGYPDAQSVDALVGQGTENTLTAAMDWGVFSLSINYPLTPDCSPFMIEFEGEFLYPEKGSTVELPAGLTPTAYKSYYTTAQWNTETQKSDYTKSEGTVNIAFDNQDVYFQGLDLAIPSAWVKGTFTANGDSIIVPVTYMGTSEDGDHYIGGYGSGAEPVALVFEYDANAKTFYCPDYVETFKSATAMMELAYYGGLFIGETKPTPVTMPAGATVVEMPVTAQSFDFSTMDWVDATDETSKVGVYKNGNEVYIQGLPAPNYCMKGQMVETQGSKGVVFPMGQIVAENAYGFLMHLYGIGYDANDNPSETAYVMMYDEANDYYEGANFFVLNRSGLSSGFMDDTFTMLCNLGLAIGTKSTGIDAVKAVKDIDVHAPAYNMAGQRVADGFKGLVIKGGKKYMVK